jgi:phenylalanyl-tRNA synthetase alpha chain
MRCVRCSGDGCPSCAHNGWIEILGAGMVHPNVLLAAGIDPKKYTGFPFGVGIDRLAMLKYGIDDIRHLYGGDLRLVNQF